MPEMLPIAHQVWLTGQVLINSTTITPLYVGSANLESRKWLMIQAAVGGTIKVFIGSASAIGTDITKAQLAKQGIKIKDGQVFWLPVTEAITIYAICSSGAGKKLRIAELA